MYREAFCKSWCNIELAVVRYSNACPATELIWLCGHYNTIKSTELTLDFYKYWKKQFDVSFRNRLTKRMTQHPRKKIKIKNYIYIYSSINQKDILPNRHFPSRHRLQINEPILLQLTSEPVFCWSVCTCYCTQHKRELDLTLHHSLPLFTLQDKSRWDAVCNSCAAQLEVRPEAGCRWGACSHAQLPPLRCLYISASPFPAVKNVSEHLQPG